MLGQDMQKVPGSGKPLYCCNSVHDYCLFGGTMDLCPEALATGFCCGVEIGSCLPKVPQGNRRSWASAGVFESQLVC
jgi:hypothetical protein